MYTTQLELDIPAMASRLITLNCSCHKDQLYLIDNKELIVKQIKHPHNFKTLKIGFKVGKRVQDFDYLYTEITDLNHLLRHFLLRT